MYCGMDHHVKLSFSTLWMFLKNRIVLFTKPSKAICSSSLLILFLFPCILPMHFFKGLPLVRWLTGQRNAYGGFSSTQDTVIALQALGAYAEHAYSADSNVTVTVSNGADNHSFGVTPSNAIVLQSYEVSIPTVNKV